MWNDQEISRRAGISGSVGEWATFKASLRGAPPETAFVLLRVMGERLPLTADPEWAIENSSDVDGLIVAGAALMVRATRVRGLDTADQVNEEKWVPYFACRGRAEDVLRSAVELAPQNGLAAAWFMASAVDSDVSVKTKAADVLVASSNVPITGYSKLLSANTEKWGGSHDAMWKVARKFAPVRSPWTRALIAKAHYEHWLYLQMMDERPEAAGEAATYFRDPAVQDEVIRISHAVDDAVASDPYEAVYAHDVLAAVLTEARMTKVAAAHLRKVGRFGDPALLTGGPLWQRALKRVFNGLPLW